MKKPEPAGRRGSTVSEETLYFTDVSARDENTHTLAEWVAGYVERHPVRNVIVASSRGRSAMAFLEALQGRQDVNLVIVKLTPEEEKTYGTFEPERLRLLKEKGIPVVMGTNALTHNVDWSLGENARAASPSALVAEAFYRFCPGVKTAVEVSLMATDAGVVKQGEQAIAVAGTNGGADTAILIRCAESLYFRQLVIEKILAKPLQSAQAG
jgi:hypothetical protein